MLTDLTVDLSLAPGERWTFTSEHRRVATSLFSVYNTDLGVDDETRAYVSAAAPEILGASTLQELMGIASGLGAALPEVLLANLHYDLLKVVLGCTAFAVDTPDGPVHGRNLDWWTTGRSLHEGTVVTRFLNGPGGEFVTVGWPGFAGAFSGVAKKRFSVTLNAVLSDEPGEAAMPVVFLIRQVLEEEPDFDSAVARLAETTIATDCLLLVTGAEPGEMVVVERTPTRFALRHPAPGEPLRVTNDYVMIDADSGEPTSELIRTSCGRFDRIGGLLRGSPPLELGDCIDLLCDEQVMMGITVQQMAFRPRTGAYLVRIP
jgi:acid ceramidase